MGTKREPKNDDLLRLDQQLCFALYAASKMLTQAYQPFLEPLGITYPQYLVFLVLWEEDQISLKALGAKLHLDSGTLTPMLKRLEKAGYLQRQRFAGDERELRIALTEQGRALKERAREIPLSMVCGLGLDMQEVKGLREQLKDLLEHFLKR